MNISIIWTISAMITLLFLLILQNTKNTANQNNASWTQFECGLSTINPPSTTFSLQFFTVALLFLIFDVEIILITSYPIEPLITNNAILIFSLILILTIGLIYEWQNSKIFWSN